MKLIYCVNKNDVILDDVRHNRLVTIKKILISIYGKNKNTILGLINALYIT